MLDKPARLEGGPERSLGWLLARAGTQKFDSSNLYFNLPDATTVQELGAGLAAKSLYVFHDLLQADAADLGGAVRSPLVDAVVESLGQPVIHQWLTVGSGGSHCGCHAHGSAINVLLCGRKRWFFYPPEVVPKLMPWFRAAQVEASQRFWAEELLPAAEGEGNVVPALMARVVELQRGGHDVRVPASALFTPITGAEARGLSWIQEAGHLVFVPDRWGHWVLNLEASAAVVFESASPGSV